MKENYVNLPSEMFHYENWIAITDAEIIKETLQQFLKEANFTVVNFVEHNFPVEGYTCVWVLAESHLAIHTFPNNKTSYLQISSCNKTKLDFFKQKIHDFNH